MLRSLWRSIPSISRAGLVLAGYGVFADFIHHVVRPNLHAGLLVHIGLIGHTFTLAGMVLALAGVVRAAVDSRRRAREKGGNDAARGSAAAPR